MSALEFVGTALPPLLLARLTPARWRLAVLALGCAWFYLLHAGVLHLLVLVALACGVWRAGLGVRRRSRVALAGGLGGLFGALAAFKYGGVVHPSLAVLAPLGLSYFVFKLSGYLLDLWWDESEAEPSGTRLAIFAAFAPQIPSGPIQRSGDFLAQFRRITEVEALPALGPGLRLILFGLFKKLVVADRLALMVDPVFAQPEFASPAAVVLATYAFAFQLYADFSGLTDIALGLGRVVGIEGPSNFDSPFMAGNLEEFWRRWHMSLTSWLADYLFLPLRMALRHQGRAGLSLAITINMLAVGVWHGARMTYVVFGLLMGVFLTASALTADWRHGWQKRSSLARAAALWLGPVVTFHVMALSWIVFRAPELSSVGILLLSWPKGLFLALSDPAAWLSSALASNYLEWEHAAITCVALVGMQLMHALRDSRARYRFDNLPAKARIALYYAAAVSTIVAGELGGGSFIYAQF